MAPRKKKPVSPSAQARRKAALQARINKSRIGRSKAEITKELRNTVNAATSAGKRASIDVISELQEIGPKWSGDFMNAWRVLTPFGETTKVPKLLKDIPFRTTRKIIDGGSDPYFIIFNADKDADIAMDNQVAVFSPKQDPIPEAVIQYGVRDVEVDGSGLRGLSNKGEPARATADLFWYQTYVAGGEPSEALRRALRSRVSVPPAFLDG